MPEGRHSVGARVALRGGREATAEDDPNQVDDDHARLHHVDPSFQAQTGGEKPLRCHMPRLNIPFSYNKVSTDRKPEFTIGKK